MNDSDRVTRMLGDLERYFGDLDALRIGSVEDLDDRRNYYSLSMLLFAIINRAIDLGSEVLESRALGVPATYRDIFVMLARGKVIDRAMERELSRLVGYRNRLSHEYSDLTEDVMLDIYRRIGVVREFAEVVKAALRG